MKNQEDIRELLDNLGKKISVLAEENRICKNNNDAGKKLISILENYVSTNDWLKIYNSTNDPFIKELMLEWGANLFPNNFHK